MAVRVVAVDDEPHIRRVVELKLQSAGFEVQTATNAADGIALAERVLPDLVISDFRMPGGLTGVDLIKALRRSPGTRETPIILLTGSIALLNKLQGDLNDIPLVTLLSKPFSPRELIGVIEKILNLSAERKAS